MTTSVINTVRQADLAIQPTLEQGAKESRGHLHKMRKFAQTAVLGIAALSPLAHAADTQNAPQEGVEAIQTEVGSINLDTDPTAHNTLPPIIQPRTRAERAAETGEITIDSVKAILRTEPRTYADITDPDGNIVTVNVLTSEDGSTLVMNYNTTNLKKATGATYQPIAAVIAPDGSILRTSVRDSLVSEFKPWGDPSARTQNLTTASATIAAPLVSTGQDVAALSGSTLALGWMKNGDVNYMVENNVYKFIKTWTPKKFSPANLSNAEAVIPGTFRTSHSFTVKDTGANISFPYTAQVLGGLARVASEDGTENEFKDTVTVNSPEDVIEMGHTPQGSGVVNVVTVVLGDTAVEAKEITPPNVEVKAETLPSLADFERMTQDLNSNSALQYFYDRSKKFIFPTGAQNIIVKKITRDGTLIETITTTSLETEILPSEPTPYNYVISYTLNGVPFEKECFGMPALFPAQIIQETILTSNTTQELPVSIPGLGAYTKGKTLAGVAEILGLSGDYSVTTRRGSGTATLKLKSIDVSDPTHAGDKVIFEVTGGTPGEENTFVLTTTNPVKTTSQYSFIAPVKTQ